MKELGCFFAIPVVFLALVGGLVVWVLANQQVRIDAYTRNCVAADGHIYKPDSISFCVSDDGRWIEVYP